MRTLAAASLLAALLAQPCRPQDPVPEILPDDYVKKLREAGAEAWDVKWMVDASGALLTFPSPSAAASVWEPYFGALQGGLGWALANAGLLGMINLLLPGPRDLLSHTDAGYHFTKLGLDLDPMALRQRVARPPEGETPALQRRAALDRLLAVRLVQDRGVRSALPELEALIADSDADRFLRRAAVEAKAALAGSRAPAPEQSQKLADVMAEVPPDAHVVFYIDQGRLPPRPGLVRAFKRLGLESTYDIILEAGGTVSGYELAGLQKAVDVQGELPFELTRRFGNLRLNWVLGALRIDSERDVAFWVRGDGWFENDRIRAGLTGEGIEVEGDRRLVAKDLPYDVSVSVGEGSIALHRKDFTAEPSAERAAELRAAGLAGHHAIWVHVPAGSSLLRGFAPTSSFDTATLTVDFRDAVLARLTLSGGHPPQVAALVRELRAQLDSLVRDLELEESEELDVVRRALQGVRVEGKEGLLQIDARGEDLGVEVLFVAARYFGLR